ncbi:uncharacterized protein N7496_012776 [Penicillium cataractarum]|uniref:Uncharacterized protein n=1 Tax=Penicillium cataractarum TaxID=2100454 RepID=A0A9W9RBF0_9EURO|nr:uncharacterized protein N7496_012776 [Penicillium cataractarum]KAJ5354343.1 hypothetical protein N7496_012776 [Penicillium cataractarum]
MDAPQQLTITIQRAYQICPEARIILFRTSVRSQFDRVLNGPDAFSAIEWHRDVVNSTVLQSV